MEDSLNIVGKCWKIWEIIQYWSGGNMGESWILLGNFGKGEKFEKCGRFFENFGDMGPY